MANAPKVPTTATFPNWLAAQQGRGDDMASFAQSVAEKTDFPESGGRAIYEGYFSTESSSQQELFERAWTEFQASPEPSEFTDPTEPR